MLIARSKPWESNDCSQLAAGLRKCCHLHGRFELKILLLESGRTAKPLGQFPGHYHLPAFPGGWFTWQASLIRQFARTLPGDWLVIARLWSVRIVSWKGLEPEEIRHSWRSVQSLTSKVICRTQPGRMTSVCQILLVFWRQELRALLDDGQSGKKNDFFPFRVKGNPKMGIEGHGKLCSVSYFFGGAYSATFFRTCQVSRPVTACD